MLKKKFNCGVLVGRFAPIHIGHERLINIALEDCQKVVIIVTSNNELDDNNPYSIEYRIHLIKKIFKEYIINNSLIIATLTGKKKIDTSYGKSILSIVREVSGCKADYIIYGNDKDITNCFSKESINSLYCKEIDRKEVLVSATDIRKYLRENNKEMLKKYLNISIQDEIDILRKI